MKGQNNIKNIVNPLFISGIVLLLLLSPCKVRNILQTELGISKTEVTNKSKTTISTIDCGSYNPTDYNTTTVSSKVNLFLSFITVSSQNFHLFTPNLSTKTETLYHNKKELTSFIPLYILYQRLKAYL